MSQKLQGNIFEWIKVASKFHEDFIKGYKEESDEGYFPAVDIQYPDKLYDLYNDLSFLTERMKTEKVEKPVTNFHDKNKYVFYIRNFKKALNQQLILKKVH